MCHQQEALENDPDSDILNLYDPIKLSSGCAVQSTSGGCFNGHMMVELYKKYKEALIDAWYVMVGIGSDNNFTVMDFLKVIIYKEMGGLNLPGMVDAYAEALAKKLYAICSQNSASGSCNFISNNAILDYLASRGSAMIDYDTYVTGKSRIQGPGYYQYSSSPSNEVVNKAVFTTNPEWRNGGWLDFGNMVLIPTNRWVEYMAAAQGPEPWEIYWCSGDRIAFVMTLAQQAYWER
jgi:hypothetical protein